MRANVTILLLSLALAGGCASERRKIQIPDAVMPNPKLQKGQKRAIEPYKIKVSDGRKVIQVEIPIEQSGVNFIVPIGDETKAAEVAETEADREVLDAPPATAGAEPGTGAAKGAGGGTEAREGKNKSYLATLARVNTMFRKKQYELAMIEIVELERQYPDDERILEMKGTLAWKLKKPKLAREAWERALALNPDNTAVQQALETLLGE